MVLGLILINNFKNDHKRMRVTEVQQLEEEGEKKRTKEIVVIPVEVESSSE